MLKAAKIAAFGSQSVDAHDQGEEEAHRPRQTDPRSGGRAGTRFGDRAWLRGYPDVGRLDARRRQRTERRSNGASHQKPYRRSRGGAQFGARQGRRRADRGSEDIHEVNNTSKAGRGLLESIWDSQISLFRINHAGWTGAWMGKPYSLDLRKRVVSAIEGGMSRNRAAKQFGSRSARQSAECSGSRRPAVLSLAR